ncbi:hypothetical protein H0H93_007795 [Arthromyces matolae]|nr:hypothetical protein H0H93_007795 [Arthromyces matolae]
MKITINIVFLVLSFSTMSITATPIKLDGAMTTQLSSSPHDLETFGNVFQCQHMSVPSNRTMFVLGMNRGSRPVQSIVKRGLLLRRMQHGTSSDQQIAIATVIENIKNGFSNLSDATQLLNELTKLTQHLKFQSKSGGLSEGPNAKSLQTLLHSWREQALKLENSGDARHIVAEIASSRNIVEEALIPWPKTFQLPPHHNIQNIIRHLETVLPGMQPSKSTVETALYFEGLKTYITKNEQLGTTDFINAKLLTFGDWVEAWDETAERREMFLSIIKVCKEAMQHWETLK